MEPRKPGAYVIEGKKVKPDLSDDAMKARHDLAKKQAEEPKGEVKDVPK